MAAGPEAEGYETVESQTRDFGDKFFLEVARKRTVDGGSEFLVLTRGFYEDDGSRRETSILTLPDDVDLAEFAGDRLAELADAGDAG